MTAPAAAAAHDQARTDVPRPRRRPVVGLAAATALSVTGNALVAVLVPLLVLDRTGSPAAAGLVAAASLVATVPALTLAGTLVDRWGRRRVSIAADLLSAAAVAALPVVDHLVGLTVASIVALVALGAAFDGPGAIAREALRPDVATAGGVRLERVNAQGEAMDGVGSVAGPALAGLGAVTVGGPATLWAAAALFVVAAAATAACVPPDRRRTVPSEPYLAATLRGLRHVWADRTLRALGLSGMLVMVFVAPLVLALTSLARGSGDDGTAGLLVAALAAGLVVGALGYGAVAGRVRRRPVLLASLLLASVALVGLSVVPDGVPATALAALTGLAFGPAGPIFAVVAQDRAPEELRGRVIGALGSLSLLAGPVGTLAAGALLEISGPSTTFLVIGLGCLLSTVHAAVTLRRIEATDLRRTDDHDRRPAPCPC